VTSDPLWFELERRPASDSFAVDDGRVDLYGNEVTHAVTSYKLDPTGMFYEEHSPQIELPKLASPKT
jgi:hypothetical protein